MHKLNVQIEDNTRDMGITIFGKTTQALIKKLCSTLTIDKALLICLVSHQSLISYEDKEKSFKFIFNKEAHK